MLATVTIGYIGFRPLLLGLALANQEPLTAFAVDSAPALSAQHSAALHVYALCDHAIPEGGEVFALNPEAAGKRHQTNGYRGNLQPNTGPTVHEAPGRDRMRGRLFVPL